MHFKDLGLSAPILKALSEEGYEKPTPIQAEGIPAILKHRDVMAAARTGTGKTAAFTLPLLERFSTTQANYPNAVRALVLTPTRELAAQVAQSVATYGKHLSVTSAVVFGGVKINPQIARLKKGVDILVATPGRLLDLYEQRAVNLSQLEVLVLDEADRMLDMGFINDIKKILSLLPKKRQNLLFSATFSHDIRLLAKGLMNNPQEISVTPPNTTVASVKQWVHPVDKKQKEALLSHLIWEGRWEQVLIFTRTKRGANKLAEFLIADGVEAMAIHGNKSQGARTRALADFKQGGVRALVATDIAARGLDIELLPHVVNFDLPQVAEDYIHRIGRTGRAGASGEAITLVCADDFRQLAEIERLIKQKLPRREVEGFEPQHIVPDRSVIKPQRSAHKATNKPQNKRFVKRDERSFEERKAPAGRSLKTRKPYKLAAKKPRINDERSERNERSYRTDKNKAYQTRDARPARDQRDGSERSARREGHEAVKTDRAHKPYKPSYSEQLRGGAKRQENTHRADRSERSERSHSLKTDRTRKPYQASYADGAKRQGNSYRTDRSESGERSGRRDTLKTDRMRKPYQASSSDQKRPSADRNRKNYAGERGDRYERGGRSEGGKTHKTGFAGKVRGSSSGSSERSAKPSNRAKPAFSRGNTRSLPNKRGR